MNVLVQYYSLRKSSLFAVIVLTNIIVIWLSKTVLIDEIVFYNTYSEQLTLERSLQLFEKIKEISWISYVFIPVMLAVKFVLVSIVLYTGAFLYNLHFKITFSTIFRIVIASDLIFIFAGLIKFLWFYFSSDGYNLNDIGFFYPLSLINLFKITEVSKVWIYPLQVVNIFQFIYIIALSFGLRKIGNLKDSDADKIVLSSYLPALVLWIALVMFISIDTGL